MLIILISLILNLTQVSISIDSILNPIITQPAFKYKDIKILNHRVELTSTEANHILLLSNTMKAYGKPTDNYILEGSTKVSTKDHGVYEIFNRLFNKKGILKTRWHIESHGIDLYLVTNHKKITLYYVYTDSPTINK